MKAKFVYTALSYIIPTMFLGYTWHFMLFHDLYNDLEIYNKMEPNIPLGFFSMILQGCIIAYFYPFYSKGQNSVKQALKFSLLMGAFLYSISTLANAAKINVTDMTIWLGIQFAFHFLQFGVAGVFIGLVNRERGN